MLTTSIQSFQSAAMKSTTASSQQNLLQATSYMQISKADLLSTQTTDNYKSLKYASSVSSYLKYQLSIKTICASKLHVVGPKN